MDGSGEFLETIDDQEQFLLSRLMLFRGIDLPIDLLQLDLQLCHFRIEVGLFDHAFGVAVDQSRLGLIQMAPLFFQRVAISVALLAVIEHVESTFVCLFEALWIR